MKRLLTRDDATIYCFSTYMKCGKQHFCVKHRKPGKSANASPMQSPVSSPRDSYYINSCIAKFRNEEIPDKIKNIKSTMIVRQFRKESSVFASWRVDDDQIIKRCLDHDFQYWKCTRFIKEKDDLGELQAVIKRYFTLLRNTYINLICLSQYPSIDRNDFTIFSRKCNFLDPNVV